jgi:uncharacterized protein YcnI
MLRKGFVSVAVCLAALVALPGIASAHAVVYPRTVNANSYEKFILRVPVEKESATVKVRVEMPAGFVVSRVKPLPGWTYQVEKGADNTVKAITWSGGQIAPGEFQEFEFQGKTAANAGKYAFPVHQTYADGETVDWTGPSDAKTPASVVEVTAAASGTTADAHGQEKPAAAAPAAQAPAAQAPAAQTPAAPPAAPATNPLTTGAAYGGLILGALALLLSLRRK